MDQSDPSLLGAEERRGLSASELALGHKLGNAVTQAYARSDMLDQRRGLMERWGNHLMTRQIDSRSDDDETDQAAFR